MAQDRHPPFQPPVFVFSPFFASWLLRQTRPNCGARGYLAADLARDRHGDQHPHQPCDRRCQERGRLCEPWETAAGLMAGVSSILGADETFGTGAVATKVVSAWRKAKVNVLNNETVGTKWLEDQVPHCLQVGTPNG